MSQVYRYQIFEILGIRLPPNCVIYLIFCCSPVTRIKQEGHELAFFFCTAAIFGIGSFYCGKRATGLCDIYKICRKARRSCALKPRGRFARLTSYWQLCYDKRSGKICKNVVRWQGGRADNARSDYRRYCRFGLRMA